MFWGLTYRELYAAFVGAAKARRRDRELALWACWNNANLTNANKLPPLEQVMRQLKPPAEREMSPKSQRAAILGMAAAMGAKVIRRKKGEAIQ